MKLNRKITLEEFISSQTLHSRRDILKAMTQNHIKVNNKLVKDMSFLIDVSKDKVLYNGNVVNKSFDYMVYRYYKPKGVLTTMDDPKGRMCVGDVVKHLKLPLYPVGRLDRQTSGLLLLTNNGDFSYRVTHPSCQIKKKYIVGLDSNVTKRDIKRLESGIFLEDGPVICDSIMLIADNQLEVSIVEGRNRIIRRVFSHLGYEVLSLKRIQIGSILLSPLNIGELKQLSQKELDQFG